MTDGIPPKARARRRQALVALDHADEAETVARARERFEDARAKIDEALETLANE